jgi:hypothetical protein
MAPVRSYITWKSFIARVPRERKTISLDVNSRAKVGKILLVLTERNDDFPLFFGAVELGPVMSNWPQVVTAGPWPRHPPLNRGRVSVLLSTAFTPEYLQSSPHNICAF